MLERGEWLTLGEASRILGVDPDTLRRWADSGKIDVFTTPGGHRRFIRSSIDAMLPRPRQARRQSLTALGEAPDPGSAEVRKRVRVDPAAPGRDAPFDAGPLPRVPARGGPTSDPPL